VTNIRVILGVFICLERLFSHERERARNASSDAFEEHRNFFRKKFEIPLHSEPLSLMFIPEQQPQNQKIWPSHKTQRNRPRSYRQKPPNKRRPLKRPRSKAQPNADLPAFYPQQHSYQLCCFFWIHDTSGEIIFVATGWSPNESGGLAHSG
jgi:hypothetical protein